MKSEVPKVDRCFTHLMIAVSITSAISNPNIKAFIGKDKCWSQMFIIDNPSI
jgi:hypothetical protein